MAKPLSRPERAGCNLTRRWRGWRPWGHRELRGYHYRARWLWLWTKRLFTEVTLFRRNVITAGGMGVVIDLSL
jgi:hypothetical protein